MEFLKSLHQPDPGPVLQTVPGSAAALALVAAGIPRLVITGDDGESRRWGRDVSFFCALTGKERPAVILSPDEMGAGERVEALKRARAGSTDFVVSSAEVALSPAPDVRGFESATVVLTRGEEVEPSFVADLLAEMGYRRVTIVAAPGEFALRGGILDVYPAGGSDLPLRAEFLGDEVETIRLFEVESQRSVRSVDSIPILPVSEPAGSGTFLSALSSFGCVTTLGDSDLPATLASLPGLCRVTTLSGVAGHGVLSLSGLGLTSEERRAAGEPIEAALERMRSLARDDDILVVCPTLGEAERARDVMRDADMVAPIIAPERLGTYQGRTAVTTGDLSGGFRIEDPGAVVITSAELFGARPVRRRAPQKTSVAGLLSSLDDLAEGDLVVHEEQGVGRYLGLRKLDAHEHEDDVLVIEYAGGDLLYLPIGSIARLRAYHGAGGASPRLDSLGGKSWKKTRGRVRKRVQEMAKELVQLYAARARAQGYAFSTNPPLYDEFIDAFPYDETPDQIKAEDEIFASMEKPGVMDHLLCGDVGYGKTEVAMRAVFKAVADGKQVAVLVPTTILAEQHFETFRNRFMPFPVKVDFLSRFKTPAARKKTLEQVASGETDIVIGTHGLLSRKMNIPNLGLLIVDEEHKFGVTHKERLQQMSTNVDVLTLSATPIPRTLHMALSGIRGISTIETAPEERMAVKTVVTRHADEVIREALEREFRRGGQVYFVHNRVESIYRVGKRLQAMFPERNLGVAHGQMPERQLENVMHAFFQGERDVLVCTSIIGSGLDVPSANTIIVDRADMFGLADLYQLRGRVGRSDVRAYAYLLIPGEDVITDEARERLSAIRELSYLGAGFRLAMKDLEIRGAGNLLGAEQSGHIDAVGFDLYTEMLEEAISELQGRPAAVHIEPVITLPVDARIPEYYLEDSTLRFTFYRRIGNLVDRSALADLGRELADRFGPFPPEVARLLELVEIKIFCRDLGIPGVRWRGGEVLVDFVSETMEVDTVMSVAARFSKNFRFLPEGGFALRPRKGTWEDIHGVLQPFLEELSQAQPTS